MNLRRCRLTVRSLLRLADPYTELKRTATRGPNDVPNGYFRLVGAHALPAPARSTRSRLHRKHPNGLNIWTCEVTGPRKSRRLHGYLLEDAAAVFADIPPNNPYLSLLKEG